MDEQLNFMYGDLNEGFITITKEEYEDLVADSVLLEALQDAGVENWEGYDLALDIVDAFKQT